MTTTIAPELRAIPALPAGAQNSIQLFIQDALDRHADAGLPLDQTLEIIAEQLALVEEQLAPLTALREQARGALAQLLQANRLDKAVTTHAALTLVPDTTIESFDATKLHSLIADLLGDGHADIAAKIVAAKKKAMRKGYLMVKPNRE